MHNDPEIAAPFSSGGFSDYGTVYQEAVTAFLQNLGKRVGSLPLPDLADLTLLLGAPLGPRNPSNPRMQHMRLPRPIRQFRRPQLLNARLSSLQIFHPDVVS